MITYPTVCALSQPKHSFNITHIDKLTYTHSQHAQMLVVRKEGKAHDQYNSFRSAFELLESVGRAPLDCFNETDEDLPPLEKQPYIHKGWRTSYLHRNCWQAYFCGLPPNTENNYTEKSEATATVGPPCGTLLPYLLRWKMMLSS